MEKIEKEILIVLAFYDIFNFPLTFFEIYKNLGIKTKTEDVYSALYWLEHKGKIKKEDGYYSFPHNSGGRDLRKARFLFSFKKIRRAKRIARIFSYFPYIRFVGVCNSLGFLNANEKSDIDFLIIVKNERLWLVRFLTASFLKIFNLRPNRKTVKDKICLSFILSDEYLDISRIALQDDPYLEFWMGWVMPLYDDGVYKKFVEANKWILEKMPNFIPQGNSETKPFTLFRHPKMRFTELWKKRIKIAFFNFPIFHKTIFKWLGVFIKRVCELYLGDWCEEEAKNIQMYVMPRYLKDASLRSDKSVVISDTMLKFHLIDRRKEYREEFYKKVSSILD